MIGVVAKLTVVGGKEKEFEAAAKALAQQVNAREEGCLQYELFKSKSEPGVYVFMEKYADKAALDAHGKSDYFLAAQPTLGGCLAAVPDINVYSAV